MAKMTDLDVTPSWASTISDGWDSSARREAIVSA